MSVDQADQSVSSEASCRTLLGLLERLLEARLRQRGGLGGDGDRLLEAQALEPFGVAVAYASVGTWPMRAVRNQLHVRLSRKIAPTAVISLSVGGQRFRLSGGGGEAWAADEAMDAAIMAAMRSASSMSVSSVDARGRRFTDRYRLAGAATALDAASLGCARIRR